KPSTAGRCPRLAGPGTPDGQPAPVLGVTAHFQAELLSAHALVQLSQPLQLGLDEALIEWVRAVAVNEVPAVANALEQQDRVVNVSGLASHVGRNHELIVLR